MRNHDRQMTDHHILPRSRGGRDNGNIAQVSLHDHEKYHALFQNMTPDEIVTYLVKHYWNNQWSWVEAALSKR